MLNNKFSDFISYFRKIQEEHTELVYFVHGTAADVMGLSRSELEYPCLWLETPELKIQENQAMEVTGSRSAAFMILWNAPEKSAEEVDLIWSKTEELALDVLSRMRKDRRERKINFNLNGVTVDPISTLFIDNDYGWRVEFTLARHLDLCFRPEKWFGKLPPAPPVPQNP